MNSVLEGILFFLLLAVLFAGVIGYAWMTRGAKSSLSRVGDTVSEVKRREQERKNKNK
jgi:hypothetical protein